MSPAYAGNIPGELPGAEPPWPASTAGRHEPAMSISAGQVITRPGQSPRAARAQSLASDARTQSLPIFWVRPDGSIPPEILSTAAHDYQTAKLATQTLADAQLMLSKARESARDLCPDPTWEVDPEDDWTHIMELSDAAHMLLKVAKAWGNEISTYKEERYPTIGEQPGKAITVPADFLHLNYPEKDQLLSAASEFARSIPPSQFVYIGYSEFRILREPALCVVNIGEALHGKPALGGDGQSHGWTDPSYERMSRSAIPDSAPRSRHWYMKQLRSICAQMVAARHRFNGIRTSPAPLRHISALALSKTPIYYDALTKGARIGWPLTVQRPGVSRGQSMAGRTSPI